MVAISTTNNGVAMAALRRVNSDLNTTQNRIATGYRVNSAKDDPSVWTTVTKMRSDVSANETLKAGISTAKAQADNALAALDQISSILDEVSKLVTAANVAGTTTAGQFAAVEDYGNQIQALVASAGLGGKNLLVAADTVSVKVAYSNGAATGSLDYTAAANYLAGTETAKIVAVTTTGTPTTDAAFRALDVSTAQAELGNFAAKLASFSKSADVMMGFQDKLADVTNSAIGGLVDADLEKETAKLQALQVRQQLAYQAISMSNNSAQNILMLFR